MKYVQVVALMLLTVTAQAATPEETYTAARDALIARFNPPGEALAPSDATAAEEERARTGLGKQLRSLIGPLDVRGFAGEGVYNVGSLFRGDVEFGMLDGLSFANSQGVRLVATTTDLANRWVKSPEGLGAEDGAAPPDLRTALQLDAFYTRATSVDAAVGNYGELPVTKPTGLDYIFAMLAARRQDFHATAPDEILIGAIAAHRVYIVAMPSAARVVVMAPCEKLLKDAEAKATRMFEANRDPDKSERIVDEMDRVREDGDTAMRECFAAHVKADPAFARLTRQAQEVVDALAGK